jgi:hypothetical protein
LSTRAAGGAYQHAPASPPLVSIQACCSRRAPLALSRIQILKPDAYLLRACYN